MTQEPTLERILPAEPASIPTIQNVEYIYEPDPVSVLGELLPRFVEMQVYHAILESIASEQSARMVAMRNATDNADEIIDDLTLMYNKVRQEMITNELLDITGGVAALV
jgi:F-type H+-transporting ATPase subunit gamma